MSRNRVFVPVISTLMSADPFIHGDDNRIQYKISYGHELENQNLVFKIQMVGDGYIKGRQAPSYSDKDFDQIVKIKEILQNADKISLKGISFSGQMHGLVILDKDDEVIRPAILWCDQRTEKECNYLNNEIGVEKISEYTGNMALTFSKS